ncbi:hypothetical protein [Paenibacillus amylolyticus]|uniref:hypothetical protein n=1 Tax=Paenibacillus amylolyticus TaxID=1451 RepID=UPI00249BE5B5|nr:hypothetical protein [Paenibacillus amylolyticus]WFA83387.1 hypothetical protein OGI70_20470 [Paenibacillus amylolyticus]
MSTQNSDEIMTEDSNPEIFIGARDLKKEVYNILPTYDLLLKQIEQIRDQGKREKGNSRKDYRRDVNNTIGIFGPRGTGKTSVLFTLINKLKPRINNTLEEMFEHNMILGIIEPDHLGDNTKIMGSIVGMLKKMVDQQIIQISKPDRYIEKEFNEYFNKGLFRSNNPLQSKMNDLIEYHMYTENEYRQLLIHTYDDLATHIKKSARLLTPDVEFREKLHELITCLIDNQRLLLKVSLQQGQKLIEEPLIFLFIDDVDLKMIRSRELIEAILQYANHPNVVTILSGDYEILRDAITLALIQDEKLMNSNISTHFKPNDEESIKKRKQILSHEYVKKIIPPARRHQLLQWNENTIPRFAFGQITFLEQLYRLFGENELFGYKNYGEDTLFPITKSYSIFDRTPRGIVNVYYHVYEVNERFTDRWKDSSNLDNEEKKEKFIMVKSIVDTILLSSTSLAAVQRQVLEKYIQWGHDVSSTYIDYSKVEDIVAFESARTRVKTEENLLLPLMILGEVIHTLLEDVRFDRDKCSELQVKVLKNILQLDSEFVNKNRHGHIVDDLFRAINFQHGLVFTQLLLDNKNWLVQEREISETEKEKGKSTLVEEQKVKWVLSQINKLIEGRDEDLFKRLFFDQYVYSRDKRSQTTDYSQVLHYLTTHSASRGDFIYYKSLYEYPYGYELWYRASTLFKAFHSLDELFINLIIMLHEQEEKVSDDLIMLEDNKEETLSHNDDLKTRSHTASRLRSALTSLEIKQQEDQEFKLTATQINRINKFIEQFYDVLFKKLRNFNEKEQVWILWKDNTKIVDAINEFLKGYAGITYTKYEEAKDKVKQLDINFKHIMKLDDFEKIKYSIQQLASNYAVWYGRGQANKLLQVLKEQAYLAPNILDSDEKWVLQNLDFYLVQVNEGVYIDDSYEKLKEDMRNKLDKGFKAAMELVVTDLSSIGIELEEDEDNENNV